MVGILPMRYVVFYATHLTLTFLCPDSHPPGPPPACWVWRARSTALQPKSLTNALLLCFMRPTTLTLLRPDSHAPGPPPACWVWWRAHCTALQPGTSAPCAAQWHCYWSARGKARAWPHAACSSCCALQRRCWAACACAATYLCDGRDGIAVTA